MKSSVNAFFAVATLAMAAQASAQVTFYEQGNFQGRSFTTERQINNLERFGFNDRASSVEVIGNRWEVCEDVRFRGRCAVLRPGKYPSLASMGLSDSVSSVKPVNRDARVDERRYAPAPAAAQITFYQQENFGGASFTTEQGVQNFQNQNQNFNDRVSSVLVTSGQWEVCEDARFSGRCAILRAGRYPSLAATGLNDRISSARIVTNGTPNAAMAPDYRQRDNERTFEANVTSVRAVVGTAEQRCWVEKEQIPQSQSNANVPAAIAGALIGGILGHQVGGGTGKDLATVGGAIAGAAVGNSVGRNGTTDPAATRDVQRCENVTGQVRPQYWDVTYNFRGVDHRVQMTAAPGPTVTVNAQGEPRAQR